MKKIIVATSLVATTAAFAGDYKINIETKGDYVSSTVKTTPTGGTTYKDESGSFASGLLRLNAQATVNENLSLRFRYRFNTAATATTRDSSSNALDFMFVDHKNSFFTTRFGKMNWVEQLGYETVISGTDLMVKSLANSNFDSAVGIYRWGVSALKSIDGVGSFALSLSNPNYTVSDATEAGTDSKNNSFAIGATYRGSFMDKMLQPLVAYTYAPQDADATNTTATKVSKKVNNTLLSAGLRSEVMGATIDADYKVFTRPNAQASAASTLINKEQKTTSIYVNASMPVDSFIPFVTYVNDKYTAEAKTAADTSFKRNTIAVGTWYKPFNDVNFRYDLHYVSAVSDYESTATNSKVDDKKIYFGIKADI